MNTLQLRNPSHPTRGIPSAVNCLATLLKEPLVRSSFVQVDGVKLLIPLINPVSNQSTPLASSQSTQQSMQVILALFLQEKSIFPVSSSYFPSDGILVPLLVAYL